MYIFLITLRVQRVLPARVFVFGTFFSFCLPYPVLDDPLAVIITVIKTSFVFQVVLIVR